ncbi:efflux RND transporter periplasmic adaptor subunit [Alcaligenaceae bacterium]|nr:efflux RND transporter periplasmic adaptor subunit [Alcaligenaceae bacterium]
MRRRYVFGLLMLATVPWNVSLAQAVGQSLSVSTVQRLNVPVRAGFDGTVEAVRRTVIAPQVAGAVIALAVREGDAVRQGQVLLRIDSTASDQAAAASQAQVQVAQSVLNVAAKELKRQRQLHHKQYISDAALERAQAQYQASSATLEAQLAQAAGAGTQSDFHLIRAPYDGIVSGLAVALGDMAMPGRPLLELYDPAHLRVAVAVAQSAIDASLLEAQVEIELAGQPPRRLVPVGTRLLPVMDTGTHTARIHLALPFGIQAVAPGMFAKVWLPVPAVAGSGLYVPARAVVIRAELAGVYVIGPDGAPRLRQVRLGPAYGDKIEVLSGLDYGERVALDPQAAARLH